MTDKAGYPQAAFGGEPRFHSVTVTGGEIWAADPPESGNWVHVNQHMALLAKLDAALSMPAPAPAQAWEPPAHMEEGYRCRVVIDVEWRRRLDGSMGWAVPDEHWGREIESFAERFEPLPAALIPDTEGGA